MRGCRAACGAVPLAGYCGERGCLSARFWPRGRCVWADPGAGKRHARCGPGFRLQPVFDNCGGAGLSPFSFPRTPAPRYILRGGRRGEGGHEALPPPSCRDLATGPQAELLPCRACPWFFCPTVPCSSAPLKSQRGSLDLCLRTTALEHGHVLRDSPRPLKQLKSNPCSCGFKTQTDPSPCASHTVTFEFPTP